MLTATSYAGPSCQVSSSDAGLKRFGEHAPPWFDQTGSNAVNDRSWKRGCAG